MFKLGGLVWFHVRIVLSNLELNSRGVNYSYQFKDIVFTWKSTTLYSRGSQLLQNSNWSEISYLHCSAWFKSLLLEWLRNFIQLGFQKLRHTKAQNQIET